YRAPCAVEFRKAIGRWKNALTPPAGAIVPTDHLSPGSRLGLPSLPASRALRWRTGEFATATISKYDGALALISECDWRAGDHRNNECHPHHNSAHGRME